MITCGSDQIPTDLIFISGVLGKTSSIFNPIIYVLGNGKYRAAVFNLLKRKSSEEYPLAEL